MKILKAKPNWYETSDNLPRLQVLVDKMPKHADLRYEQRGPLYYAELDGYVDFYAYSKPGQGYGGRMFELTMVDGSKKVLHGPWSSRPSAMNLAGFTPSCDVEITDEPAAYERGYTFCAGHITVEALKTACALAGLHAVEWDAGWYPSLLPGAVVKLYRFYDTKKVVARWMNYGEKPLESLDAELSQEQHTVVMK